MQISYPQLRNEIVEKNYATVSSSISMRKLELAAFHFMHLLESTEFKRVFAEKKIDPDNRSSRIGYFQKTTLKSYPTTTDFFHYNDYVEHYFREEFQNSSKEVETFFQLAREIYDESKYLMQKIILLFEKEFPGIYERFFPLDKKPYFYLRFLKYHPDPESDNLALGHYDRGGCTLALAESNTGLRIGKDQFQIVDVGHEAGEVLFIPGLMFPEITNSQLQPGWHDVIQRQDQYWSRDTARWSIVFFAGYTGMRNVHFEEAHTTKTS